MLFSTYKNKFCRHHGPQHANYHQELEALFQTHYPQASQLSLHQRQELTSVIEHAQDMEQALKPLVAGKDYKLMLVGGAVRDIVMNRVDSIGDYDFLLELSMSPERLSELARLSFNQKHHEKVQELSTGSQKDDFLSNHFMEQDNTVHATQIVLLEKLLQNRHAPVRTFHHEEVADKYLNKHIKAIFQFPSPAGRKIDVILSAETELLGSFDFEICKGHIELHQLFALPEAGLEDKLHLCMDNMWLRPGMLKDINDKTLSICLDHFNVEHIHYFMNKHFLKLHQKFPEYRLHYFDRRPQAMQDKKEEVRTLEHYRLQYSLEAKENVRQKNKL